jgi:hypothetical protein
MRCRFLGAAIAGLSVCLTGGTGGAATELGALDRVLETLNSDDFQTRDGGMDALENLFVGRLDALLALLSEEELSGEQRARMMLVAKDLFRSSPRGAMGITMGNWQGRGLLVSNTIEGFPVHQLGQLLPGDVILKIDGIDLAANQQFARGRLQAEVISREPGEKLSVVILRPSAEDVRNAISDESKLTDPVELEQLLTLGDWAHLRDQQMQRAALSNSMLDPAWALRLGRAGVLPRQTLPVLKSRTEKTTWAKASGTFELPRAKFFIAADSQVATLLLSGSALRVTQQLKRDTIVTRQDGKPVDTRVNGLVAEHLPVQALPAQGRVADRVRAQMVELLALEEREQQLRRDSQDRSRTAQERHLIAEELAKVVERRKVLKATHNQLIAENQGD